MSKKGQTRRMNEEEEEPPQPKIPWEKSRAKELLTKDILEDIIPLVHNADEWPYQLIFEQRAEYAEYGFRLFPNRVRSLREQLTKITGRAKDDTAAYEKYKANHAASAKTCRGYLEWEGSEAQRLLGLDLDAGKYKGYPQHNNDDSDGGGNAAPGMTPKELWLTQSSYREFPLKVFRDHIAQEIKTRKFYHTLKVRGKSHYKGGRKKK